MFQCLACGKPHESPDDPCPFCGAAVPRERGVLLLSAEPAGGEAGYDASYFAELAASEAGSFWFRARNRLILWALETYCPGFGSLLEIGCGTGFVLSGIAARFPAARLSGSEIHSEGLDFAVRRLPAAAFMRMDARAIPFTGAFDVVGAFDVLEHIRDDALVLGRVRGALRPGGTLILSVPQHGWLWSPLDDSARHVRRYGWADLSAKLAAAGFSVERGTSFVTLLLPFMLLSRFAAGRRRADAGPRLPEVAIHPWLDRVFSAVMALEFLLIRAGLPLPLGGSLLVVARKASAAPTPSPGAVE